MRNGLHTEGRELFIDDGRKIRETYNKANVSSNSLKLPISAVSGQKVQYLIFPCIG
ncbi:MAG: hypothetical protein K2Y01_00780 [Rhabdochlamydiaceae bacterium]|nr:hypothetical protein [Rhabdochlamydiaceae bacterium]